MKTFRSLCFTFFFALAACAQADNDITISDAWARATAPGQKVAAAYMNLSSKQGAALIRAECDLAGSVEIHSMTMENDVMKMRMLEELALPAGKTVSLAPGGFHLMLFNLKQPLDAGKQAKFTLHFRTDAGEDKSIDITMPIKTSAN
jgi:copper(I)-binding protein